MSFPSKAIVATLFVLALGYGVRSQAPAQAPAQAPVQTSTQATAPPPDGDFYALRGPAAAGDAQAQYALGKDRKSTRLNSSHTVISYAVFCWKKKQMGAKLQGTLQHR